MLVKWSNKMSAYDYLSGISLTIDTREQDEDRISIITDFFSSRGASVQLLKCEYVDYHLEGYYADKEINIGIEYKTGVDFSGSFTLLNNRLALACGVYDNVGLILQHNHNSILDANYDTYEKFRYRYNVKKDLTLYTDYSSLQNTLRSFANDGVVVGQIKDIWEFPRQVVSMLNYVTNEDHKGLHLDGGNDKQVFRNMLLKIPGIGPRISGKLVEEYSCIGELFGAKTEDLADVIGKKKTIMLMETLGEDVRYYREEWGL